MPLVVRPHYLDELVHSIGDDRIRVVTGLRRCGRGRELLRPKAKYYFEDLGLRNALLDFPLPERGHLLENVVYGKLSLRGYEVGVGRVTARESVGGERRRTSYECDFVAGTADSRVYVQSTWSIDGDGRYEREVRPFRAIRDSWPKVLVVGNRRGRFADADGIIVIGAIDFLLDPSLLPWPYAIGQLGPTGQSCPLDRDQGGREVGNRHHRYRGLPART